MATHLAEALANVRLKGHLHSLTGGTLRCSLTSVGTWSLHLDLGLPHCSLLRWMYLIFLETSSPNAPHRSTDSILHRQPVALVAAWASILTFRGDSIQPISACGISDVPSLVNQTAARTLNSFTWTEGSPSTWSRWRVKHPPQKRVRFAAKHVDENQGVRVWSTAGVVIPAVWLVTGCWFAAPSPGTWLPATMRTCRSAEMGWWQQRSPGAATTWWSLPSGSQVGVITFTFSLSCNLSHLWANHSILYFLDLDKLFVCVHKRLVQFPFPTLFSL